MKKAMILSMILAAILLAGCGVADRFKAAEKQYLQTRVAQLVSEMPTEVAQTVEPIGVTEEAKVVETEVVAEETAVVAEPTVAATEEPVEETPAPTAEPTAKPTKEPTVVSSDPAVYLGTPTLTDEMDKVDGWDVSASEFDLATFENGAMTLKALSELPGWRIVPMSKELTNAYMEATVKTGACSGTDSYGLVFRVPKNVNFDQGYFFAVTCDGRYSLRKWNGLSGDTGISLMLKNLTASSLINKGKNQINRVGVAAVDDSLVLFINGEKVDEITDATYPSGFFGVFINSDVTKDLTVYVEQVRYWADPIIK